MQSTSTRVRHGATPGHATRRDMYVRVYVRIWRNAPSKRSKEATLYTYRIVVVNLPKPYEHEPTERRSSWRVLSKCPPTGEPSPSSPQPAGAAAAQHHHRAGIVFQCAADITHAHHGAEELERAVGHRGVSGPHANFTSDVGREGL